MPVDPQKALGAELPPVTGSWAPDDVILYHLGVGAGNPPTDPGELAYTYEDGLKVLPTFGVISAAPALGGMLAIPGLEINWATLLHGEQDLTIHRPLPTAAKVVTSGRVAGLYDKGKAALLVLDVDTSEEGGDLLFTNRYSLFLRGEGGFGGEAGPQPGNIPPERAADFTVDSPTLPQQALLYRLSGDKNPLHADPAFAKLGGFDQPILHGLCTYGVICKAVVDGMLDGDVTQVARYEARFAGVVYPGETISTAAWREGDRILVQAYVKERDVPVLTNAAITLR